MSSSILEKSKKLVEKIYEAMNQMESCEVMIDAVREAEVVVMNADGQITDIAAVLTSDQMAQLKGTVLEMLQANNRDAEAYLEELTGEKKAVPEKRVAAVKVEEFDSVIDEMIAEVKRETRETTKVALLEAHIEQIREEYMEHPATWIADKYNVPVTTVRWWLDEKKIKKGKKNPQ